MKRREVRAALGLTALAAAAASCTSQPVLLPSRDFDRPSDITFVCVGALDGAASGGTAGELVVTGRPMRECHPRGKADPAPATDHRTFAFVPNSSSGDLTVIDADKWSLINLDPANPNFNRLPVGVLPSQIVSSDDGCRVVTANHGSCDLSFVDPAALLAPTLASQTPGSTIKAPDGARIVTDVVPTTRGGRALHLYAGEVAFLPEETSSQPATCGGNPNRQWQALVTFPSCDLVALMDLPSGVIQQAAYVRKKGDGVALVPLAEGEEPVCPVADCLYAPGGADAGADASSPDGSAADGAVASSTDGAAADGTVASPDAASSDAGAVDAGMPIPGGPPYVGPGALRPSAIAINPQARRAYVGLTNAGFVLAFNFGNGKIEPQGDGAIPLHEGALGVTRLRLSIDPYKDVTGSTPGNFIGNDPGMDTSRSIADRQYLYVIARDGTLRVVQVADPSDESECETNKDFGNFDPALRESAMSRACWHVVGPSDRRPGAIGPGIRTPTPPIDVAVVDVRPTMMGASETTVAGAHAYVLTANGSTFLVNLDPVRRNIFWVEPKAPTADKPAPAVVLGCSSGQGSDCKQEPEPTPNTLRNRSFLGYTPSLDPSVGLPRLDTAASQPATGPRIESIWTVGSAVNYTAQAPEFIKTQVYFPDPAAVTPQAWTVTWEGNLMGSPRYSGQVISNGPTQSLRDVGADFCRLNVVENDLVTLQGCTDTNQCGIGKECVIGSNGSVAAGGAAITGLCLAPENRNSCGQLLSTIRRYDVTSMSQHELQLAPHKDELVRRTGMPCMPTPTAGDGGVDGSADARGGATDGATDGAGSTADAASDAGATDGGAESGSPLGGDDCFDSTDPSTAKFKCATGDFAGRCLYPCSKPGDTSGCRTGRICVQFGSQPDCSDGKCFCADAPALTDITRDNACVGELLPYQLSVGRGYLVAGSQTALPQTRMADPKGSGSCVAIPGLDERANIRISVDAPPCSNIATTAEEQSFDSRCDPNTSVCAVGQPQTSPLQNILITPNEPVSCVFIGGGNETDPSGTVAHHLRAQFRNREIQFIMTNLERPPSGASQIRFDVHGGFQPQLVAVPSTVEVAMPARIVLGPFDANPQTGTVGAATSEVPYLFVVDQRRLGRSQGGGPTRGQLLRINPTGYVVTSPLQGSQPWYEDLNHSANLFPIQ